MDRSLCKLTLVGPPHTAEQIIELLIDHEPPVRGFTSWSAEGHGQGFENASLEERVRGFVRRKVLVTVTTRETARSILRTIGERLAVPHLTYWIEPIEDFGQMLSTTAVAHAPASKTTQENNRERVS